MLEEVKLSEINYLVDRLSREELVWLNGYVSGLIKSSFQTETKKYKISRKITITFGTETGNSKRLATEFAAKARRRGLTVKLSSLDQYRITDLSKEETFITIISTHGEGEPPSSAKKFFDHIHETKPSLSKVQFAVLALGDTAYPLFCQAGEALDAQLELLGGERITTLQKCDVDFELEANHWFDGLIQLLDGKSNDVSAQPKVERQLGRKFYSGTILSKVNLNGSGSAKETYHIEISADKLVYQPGDSIGIVPKNSKEDAAKIISFLGLDESKAIYYKEQEYTITYLLTEKLSISYLPERVVNKYAAIVNQNIPPVRIDLIDLLKIYPPQNVNQAEEILKGLDPISPRLYSISSSLLAHEGEVHITVARNCFQFNNAIRHGLCSDYLSHLLENSVIEFYVHKNSQFRLPLADKNIIMIGPGTGIAPFRAFIEERVNSGAEGKNWLFFGDQHFASDFLYQTEWQDYLNTSGLTKMNVAFSRDQQEKIYVQHKMMQHSIELFQWIDSGAHVYVCGAKDPMSVDVERVLIEIIKNEGKKNHDQAQEYLDRLVKEGRYLKDVY